MKTIYVILLRAIENDRKLQLRYVLGLLINWNMYYDFIYEHILCTVYILHTDETYFAWTHIMDKNKWIV